MRYSIIGLGKLGASMMAAIASRGHDVIGVDVNESAVMAVNAGRAPVQETDLEKTIQANKSRIRATKDHAEAIANSDVSFVIVPTPSERNGIFSLQYANWAFRSIGRGLKAKAGYHLVVMTSTVVPGSTRNVLLPILERESGKSVGDDIGLCYSPEFIALGSVIRDFLNPDFTLVGEFDRRSGDLIERCYKEILLRDAPCKRMSFENAELAKLAVNTYVTTKIAYANMIARLCEALPGGDVDIVTDALGADVRIGRKYLTGGFGYGGPCFPRDNKALTAFAAELGIDIRLPGEVDSANRAGAVQHADKLAALVKPGSTVAVLGLAYKPGSHVVEESAGLSLALELSSRGFRVVAYDPLAGAAARTEARDKILVLDDPRECIAQGDAVVIANADPAFRDLIEADFPQRSGPKTVVFDGWRLLKANLSRARHIQYVPLGAGGTDSQALERLMTRLKPQ